SRRSPPSSSSTRRFRPATTSNGTWTVSSGATSRPATRRTGWASREVSLLPTRCGPWRNCRPRTAATCCSSMAPCDHWSRSRREAVTVRGKRKFWQFRAAADDPKVGELLLYGEISDFTWWGDEVTPRQFREDLEALGDIDELRVYINSPGGDVFAGQAILSTLKRHKARKVVYIDGLAASAASVVA